MVQVRLKKVNKEILYATKKRLEGYFRANKISVLVKVQNENTGEIEIRGEFNDAQKVQIDVILKQAKEDYRFDYEYAVAA